VLSLPAQPGRGQCDRPQQTPAAARPARAQRLREERGSASVGVAVGDGYAAFTSDRDVYQRHLVDHLLEVVVPGWHFEDVVQGVESPDEQLCADSALVEVAGLRLMKRMPCLLVEV